MNGDRIECLIERLLSAPIGQIFVSNVMNQIDVSHLEEDVFRHAWRHVLHRTTPVPRDAAGVISEIEKWPGRPGETRSYPAVWLQGLQRPDELDYWRAVELNWVCRTESWNARLDAAGRLSRVPAVGASPIARERADMLWFTRREDVSLEPGVDRVRDLLGLVHHTKESSADLTVVTFAAGTLSELRRPTPLDSGANSRFFGVCEAEWQSRTGGGDHPFMGSTADSKLIRERLSPYAGVHEAVAVVDRSVVAHRIATTHLGVVTTSAADDAQHDKDYEDYVRGSRTERDMEIFLRK